MWEAGREVIRLKLSQLNRDLCNMLRMLVNLRTHAYLEKAGAYNTTRSQRVPSGKVAFPRPEAGCKTMLIDK